LEKRLQDWLDRASHHQREGRLDRAIALYRRVLQLDPAHVDAVSRISDSLEGMGRTAEAIRILERAVKSSPHSGELRARLGDAYHAQGDLARAIGSYEKAVEREPSLLGPWWGLGCALASLGDHAPAVESFRRLIALRPDHGLALHNLGKSLFELGQVDAAVEAFRQATDHLPPDSLCLALGNIAVVIPGAASAQNRDVLEARREWATNCLLPPSAPNGLGTRGPASKSPVRLGYVSAFFQKRNWMKPVWGLINHHDRDRFEVHLFSDGPASEIGDDYVGDPRDRFHDVRSLSNAALARLIDQQGIDIVVDLNGYSRPSRLALFAFRPAPVQVAWFNMFATSGLPGIDYLIGDDHVLPFSEEPCYSERVVRVAGTYLAFEVRYPVPEVAPPPCLARGALTFGCLAPQYKITTEVVRAWATILKECPGTRLLLKNVVLGRPAARDFVRGLFDRHSIPSDRIILDGPDEHYTFLQRYADIDLALDTFPYNGGTTTMESLWQGVPVLTFIGDRWAARISASLLREAGLPEFVADDLEGYAALAIALVRDAGTPERLGSLRRTMRDRLRNQPVCDANSFARNMEEVYLKIWRQDYEVRDPPGPERGRAEPGPR
jgi:predicted O-linked N-acetylglucosamine transferase (SPINDLY family)